ncbi:MULTISPECIES: ABC transporter permease [unclassified Romboutsia]|uniref:ABC transporter permease n=1 Tax=unclassified Romboutsia TaxID=2626894 RepID=UPI002FE6627A
MGKWEGFTFKWYQSLFQDERIMTALFYTIVIAVVASLVATIIGTITAIGIHNMKRGKLKKVILNVNNLPILNPDVVTGVSLMTLFVFLNVEFGFKTILLSHIVFNIPYVILSVLPKLKQLPPNIEDAAMDLGATPMYALKKVVIPQIKPGIISGMLIAFTMSIDDFVISFFTAGNGVTNLSIEIYSMTRRGISPEINALSTIMFVVVLILLILSNVSGKKQPVLNKE